MNEASTYRFWTTWRLGSVGEEVRRVRVAHRVPLACVEVATALPSRSVRTQGLQAQEHPAQLLCSTPSWPRSLRRLNGTCRPGWDWAPGPSGVRIRRAAPQGMTPPRVREPADGCVRAAGWRRRRWGRCSVSGRLRRGAAELQRDSGSKRGGVGVPNSLQPVPVEVVYSSQPITPDGS